MYKLTFKLIRFPSWGSESNVRPEAAHDLLWPVAISK